MKSWKKGPSHDFHELKKNMIRCPEMLGSWRENIDVVKTFVKMMPNTIRS